MQQQISGNTYIQFSFEKSLRKYQKQPYKKIKLNTHCSSKVNNQCSNNNHSTSVCNNHSTSVCNNHSTSVCRHCIQKMKRNYLQSNERLVQFQNSRKNQIMRSRNLAREFSETKLKKQRESSIKLNSSAQNSSLKDNTSIKHGSSVQNKDSNTQNMTRRNYHQPLSEFKLDEQLNITIERNNQQEKEIRFQSIEANIGLSIEKNLDEVKQNANDQCGFMFSVEEKQSRIIEEQSQDESFCHIKIGNLAKLHGDTLEKQQENAEKFSLYKTQTKNQAIFQSNQNKNSTKVLLNENYSKISYAYFSSCSSLDSCQSDQMLIEQVEEKINVGNNRPQNTQDNPFELLKLQSKEELKKECQKQYRQRIFYKIKQVNQADQVLSECESISENIQHQLSFFLQNNPNPSEQQNKPSTSSQTMHLVQNNQINHSEKNQNESNHNDDCSMQHQIEQPLSIPQSQNDEQPGTNPSFKRDRKTLSTPFEQSTRRKATKINFQIEQNYQCLGRIRISGLGEEKESICLSIRRFSDSSKSTPSINRTNNIKIDKSKMVDYLISQRPYLFKSRQQLIQLLSEIIDSQQDSSVAKRLFQ